MTKSFIIALIFTTTANHLFSMDDSLFYAENFDDKLFRICNNIDVPVLESIVKICDRAIIPASFLTPPTLFTISRINDRHYDENSAVLLGLSNMVTTGAILTLKNTVKRDRPFNRLKNIKDRGKDPFIDRYSFPSGHTAFAFSNAGVLSLRYNDKPFLIAGLYSYALFVGFGRVYLGVHYPTDVLAGAVLGTGSALLVYSLRKEIISAKNSLFNEKDRQDRNQKSSIPGIVVLSTFAGTEILNLLINNSENEILQRTNFSLTGESIGFSIAF